MLMIPRTAWKDYDILPMSITSLILSNFRSEESTDLLENYAKSVKSVYNEIWMYREDLTYFPKGR